jgi:hypothetical protein
VPGFADAVIDLVPVDYVAEASVALSMEERAIGNCFHLCAGHKRCSTLGEITEAAALFFSLKSPRFINLNLFFAFIKPLLYLTLWGKSRKILRDGAMYRPYFQVKTLFDTSRSEAMLTPLGIHPPETSEYLEKLFLYCRKTDWGAHPCSENQP